MIPKSETFKIDCMEYMRSLPDRAFDWVIADVPYGLNVGQMAYLQEVKRTVLQSNGSRLPINKTIYQKTDWDKECPPQIYFDEVKRISRKQIIFGVEYVNWQGLGEGRIKWNKGIPEELSFKSYELAYASFTNETIEIDLLWHGFRQAESLQNPMKQQGNKKLNEKRIHPTQKPVLLYKKLLQDFVFRGETVFDSHLGSGSSRIACWDLGVDFVGTEINSNYWEAQELRFQQYKEKFSLF